MYNSSPFTFVSLCFVGENVEFSTFLKRYSYIAYNTFSIITYFIYFICLFTFMPPIFWRSSVSMDAVSSRLMTDIGHCHIDLCENRLLGFCKF